MGAFRVKLILKGSTAHVCVESAGDLHNKTLARLKEELYNHYIYSLFHKTLPKSSFLMHWISVRLYEMGDS